MHARAYIFLILTTLMWGGNSVAGKFAIGHVSPMLLTFSRWFLAFAILLAIYRNVLRADWPKLARSLPLLAVLGAGGFALFNIAQYTALYFTSAINVSVEQSGIPMAVFLLNFLFFRQKAGPIQIFGLVLSVAGVVLTAAHGSLDALLHLDLNFGDLLMLGAIVIYAAYTVGLRFKPDVQWQSLMIVMCGFAALTTVPFVIVEYMRGELLLTGAQGWVVIAYVVIGPSMLAQALYILGVGLIGANRASVFVNLVPIFGTLLSIILLGEEFHLYHAVALALVFGGIWLAEHGGRKAVA